MVVRKAQIPGLSGNGRRDLPAFSDRKIPYNLVLCYVGLEETPHSMRRMAESAQAGKDGHFELPEVASKIDRRAAE